MSYLHFTSKTEITLWLSHDSLLIVLLCCHTSVISKTAHVGITMTHELFLSSRYLDLSQLFHRSAREYNPFY